MRRIRSSGGRGSLGQLDKLLVIGLGLVIVLLVHFAAPFGSDRPTARAGGASAQATAAPTLGAATATPGAAAAAAPSPAASPTPRGPDPPWFRISAGGDGANMRQAPSTSAPIVQKLADNTVVDNLDEQRSADGLTWRHVKEGDVDGWVAAELLQPQRE
ncbi:MAG TPA: SH3 domain-containing protein [Chloroflexota bacterium]|nr:SH3 domain-containing protein [Chloroflexota bacterium]